ncbi:uncharacterized protein ARMOST_08617 [Armillaria ostoyae]|uniref:Uncharacterized protein n=1 Tax=Armillaria ostoyae TaxID=47428 RepID=A0A284R951_ARMOS|nr:uncharacterized protein ARMOST_08617 [Armillaria ostoyae]
MFTCPLSKMLEMIALFVYQLKASIISDTMLTISVLIFIKITLFLLDNSFDYHYHLHILIFKDDGDDNNFISFKIVRDINDSSIMSACIDSKYPPSTITSTIISTSLFSKLLEIIPLFNSPLDITITSDSLSNSTDLIPIKNLPFIAQCLLLLTLSSLHPYF